MSTIPSETPAAAAYGVPFGPALRQDDGLELLDATPGGTDAVEGERVGTVPPAHRNRDPAREILAPDRNRPFTRRETGERSERSPEEAIHLVGHPREGGGLAAGSPLSQG